MPSPYGYFVSSKFAWEMVMFDKVILFFYNTNISVRFFSGRSLIKTDHAMPDHADGRLMARWDTIRPFEL